MPARGARTATGGFPPSQDRPKPCYGGLTRHLNLAQGQATFGAVLMTGASARDIGRYNCWHEVTWTRPGITNRVRRQRHGSALCSGKAKPVLPWLTPRLLGTAAARLGCASGKRAVTTNERAFFYTRAVDHEPVFSVVPALRNNCPKGTIKTDNQERVNSLITVLFFAIKKNSHTFLSLKIKNKLHVPRYESTKQIMITI